MKYPFSLGFISACLLWAGAAVNANDDNDSSSITLNRIGTYASGLFEAGGAEIVAHDPRTQRLFVVNAQSAGLDVLSIANPAAPTKVGEIDLKPHGAVANSVAVHDGIIAVAVENVVKTDPGVVVFFDRKLKFLSKVTVGALPDMLTFTPKRRLVLDGG